ncbi:thiopeptide-type bacteriocin biosynthesis protein [Flavobacterium sp. LS1R49]|uniref:Thiopeptide-type bacteriocin biosynthesis protein n=1 Tax=Flavobacterium shii TaxID=2987687 RepID=A0A9X2ZGU7_9FLAO|nr:thiopeptide-type bacteriocin biosynthesis protein [Flavobacterium shii]MCV9930455.1 thiopeptide-type bacteriocin biosynthesis protein [Flavobacterium shii]
MKRDFCLGSEWLYYKIYTGVKTADTVLVEKLYPIISLLKEKNLIGKWFFIRYKDPDEHLRIRFHINSPNKLSETIGLLYPVLNQLLEQDIVWKVQTDTYKREIERYGRNTMIDSEFIFWQDSEMILQYLTIKHSFANIDMQLLFSFCTINSFLDSFSLTNMDKLNLMNDLQLSFKNEFGVDKILKKEMDKQYRELSHQIHQFLSGAANDDYSEINMLIEEKQNQTNEAVLRIKENLQIPNESHTHDNEQAVYIKTKNV